MGISKQQALDCLRSTDLIGVGMEADAVRRALHPENVVSYAIQMTANSAPESFDAGGGGRLNNAELTSIAAAGALIGDDLAEVMERYRQAHAVGLDTTAGMVFGAGESLEQMVEHLFAIREIQEATGGFTAFSPSCVQPGSDGIEAPTAVEYMRILAVSRLVLDNIENVESNCVKQGLKVFQMALRFGANDAGSITNERDARFTEEDLRRVIRDAGFRPVERDAIYRTMYLD